MAKYLGIPYQLYTLFSPFSLHVYVFQAETQAACLGIMHALFIVFVVDFDVLIIILFKRAHIALPNRNNGRDTRQKCLTAPAPKQYEYTLLQQEQQ